MFFDVCQIFKCRQMETANTTQNRLGQCEVCAFNIAKYTCPKCEVKTCSLKCNKIHKTEVECDGQRNKTKFIPVNKFTNLDLASDYRLLEEASRVVELSKKGSKTFPNRFRLPHFYWKLREEASKRKTHLKFLPNTFVRHKNNTTRLDFRTKTINWHLDLIFTNANNLKFSEKQSENTKLASILQKYLDNKEMQEKLEFYQSASFSGIKLLLKAEQKKGKKFYEIDPSLTLKDCLKGKVIIEYPTIYVVLRNHEYLFEVIDSDDEDSKQIFEHRLKSGNEVINKIVQKSESDDGLGESLKNLLFTSDYSEEET